MSLYSVIVHVLTAIALAGIVFRLAVKTRAGDSLQCHMRFHLWTLAHVLLIVGLLARLFGMESVAVMSVVAGLALYFGTRWLWGAVK